MPLDIGVGLVLGVFLSMLTSLNYSLCLALGILAALLPDLDYIWSVLRTKRLPHTEHRDGLHYPLIFVPAAGLVGCLFDPWVGLVFALGSLCHFIHDSIGIGFGVKWLYPFRNNSYLFFFQIKTPANKNMPKQRLYSWNDKQRAEMIKKYVYPDWIKYVYFRPNPFGLFEYAVLLLGICVAVAFI
jgi:hypothetical protein